MYVYQIIFDTRVNVEMFYIFLLLETVATMKSNLYPNKSLRDNPMKRPR